MRRAHLSEGYGSEQTSMLDQGNDSMTNELSDKVKALKSLSIDIGHEVRDQNKFLQSMVRQRHHYDVTGSVMSHSPGLENGNCGRRLIGRHDSDLAGTRSRTQAQRLTWQSFSADDDFDKSGGFLGQTMKRVQAMARAGHNRYILYLILFSLFVFLVLWLIIKSS